MELAVAKGGYGVKQVRGPFLRLAPHPESCESDHGFVTYARSRSRPIGADLFCGAGGLSLGLKDAGFDIILGVDHDPEALETHRHLFGGLSLDLDLADDSNVQRVVTLCKGAGVNLIAGGPPCQPFSRAGRAGIKDLIRLGRRNAHDTRRDLWQSFLAVIDGVRPDAVLMENVPDMALDRDMQIIRTFVETLEEWGYSVENRVIETWRHGVPQMRSRLILVALKNGLNFEWPKESTEIVAVREAIGDLPEVEGGARPEGAAAGWWPYLGAKTSFQKRARSGVSTPENARIYDHITRPVRADDLLAFEQMDSTTKYSDLPNELKRYRDDIFDDKYKRLSWDDLSRTITAHIAKDGYWYIHPREHRTLTVREAARLQTFPDHIRFAGPPSAAFRQIGNAVPPLLGLRIGQSILTALRKSEPVKWRTSDISLVLAVWFREQKTLGIPWLRPSTRWSAIQAELLLDRASPTFINSIWPLIGNWVTPDATLLNATQIREIGSWINRSKQAEKVISAAKWLSDHPDSLHSFDGLRSCPEIGSAVADFADRVCPKLDAKTAEALVDPVLATKGILRVAARFTGKSVDKKNSMTDGRLAIGRLVGAGETGDSAHLALFELANSICTPVSPKCSECPISTHCCEAARRNARR